MLVQPADGVTQLPVVPVRACTLAPTPDTNVVSQLESVIATVTTNGQPAPGVLVDFLVTAGPNAGNHGTATTDASGLGTFTYTGLGSTGPDSILATGTINSLGFTGATTVVWINSPPPPPTLTYALTETARKCRFKKTIDRPTTTTNVTSICNISYNLTVTNTGMTNTSAFRLRLWAQQGSVFNPSAGVPPRLIRVKALKNNQVATTKFTCRLYSYTPFIYTTDTNNNVLATLQLN